MENKNKQSLLWQVVGIIIIGLLAYFLIYAPNESKKTKLIEIENETAKICYEVSVDKANAYKVREADFDGNPYLTNFDENLPQTKELIRRQAYQDCMTLWGY